MPASAFRRFLSPTGIPHLVALALLLLAGRAHAQPADSERLSPAQLARAIEDTIEAEAFAGAWWGLQIVNLDTRTRVYSRNASRSFVPASNVKLLTAAAALDRLGPDFRYETRVYVDGPVKNGVLQGNVIVRGSGDPSLGGYEQRDDPTKIFRRWADSLRARGIHHIEGDIIGDDDPFSDRPLGNGWSWDWVPYYYAAEPNGLVFHSNTIDLIVSGRRPGQPARVEWGPYQTDFVEVHNRTRTVSPDSASDSSYDRALGTNRIDVASQVHPDTKDTSAVTITEPTAFFSHVLRETFLREGISVEGHAMDVDRLSIKPEYEDASVRQVASHRSPPLRQLIRTMNQESHNLYAEQLLRTLAVENAPDTNEAFPEGSSRLGALAVRASLADAAGIDTSRVQLAGGSGLSRKNLVSPQAFARLLTHLWTDADSSARTAFYQSLPTGGKNGTLEYRFGDGSPARGNVRAKTGTLSNVSALSGYVRSQGGTPYAFVILCNHHMADWEDPRAAQDAIVNLLASLSE